jgi:hypothetical protein
MAGATIPREEVDNLAVLQNIKRNSESPVFGTGFPRCCT